MFELRFPSALRSKPSVWRRSLPVAVVISTREVAKRQDLFLYRTTRSAFPFEASSGPRLTRYPMLIQQIAQMRHQYLLVQCGRPVIALNPPWIAAFARPAPFARYSPVAVDCPNRGNIPQVGVGQEDWRSGWMPDDLVRCERGLAQDLFSARIAPSSRTASTVATRKMSAMPPKPMSKAKRRPRPE